MLNVIEWAGITAGGTWGQREGKGAALELNGPRAVSKDSPNFEQLGRGSIGEAADPLPEF